MNTTEITADINNLTADWDADRIATMIEHFTVLCADAAKYLGDIVASRNDITFARQNLAEKSAALNALIAQYADRQSK